jgi:hypothetical protein
MERTIEQGFEFYSLKRFLFQEGCGEALQLVALLGEESRVWR